MSSDLAQTIGKVPILTGQSNYHKWSIKIKAATHFANVWKAIQGTNKAITSNASDQATFKAWEEKAIGLITHMVSSHLKIEFDEYQITDITIKPSTKHDVKANKLWDHLKTKFEKKDGISMIINYRCLTWTNTGGRGSYTQQANWEFFERF